MDWVVGCCQDDSDVEVAAIEARKLILSWTARCCLSIFVVDFDVGNLNIERDSSENNLLTGGACACDCCCWLSWISASSMEDDVDDDADDDDWRLVDADVDDVLFDDGFAVAKSMKIIMK